MLRTAISKAAKPSTIRFMSSQPPRIKETALLRDKAYINGEWVGSSKNFDVFNPATGAKVGTAPDLTTSETSSAIQAASSALPSFSRLPPSARSSILQKWHDLMHTHSTDLATLVTLENGKPTADALGEVSYAASFLSYFSGEAVRIHGDTITSSNPTSRILTLKQPIGVVALLTPWNFPLAMLTRKVAPALAAGCPIVIKAPSETPLSALALAHLAHLAGIPKGVLNIITTHTHTAAIGRHLCEHPAIKKLSFTGSTSVGKLLMAQSSSTLKKLSFELGGNAPLIVFDDADIDAAVEGTVASKFRSSGQTCVCANRIYVQKGVYEEFVAKLVEKVKVFKLGVGYDEGVTHGPLIHSRAIEKVQSHVDDAVAKGGKVLVGGRRATELGENFFEPTVIRDMTDEMVLCKEETFGPVAGVFSFETEEEVVRRANQSEVGLAGYFFSRDLGRVWRVAEGLEVGMVGVNTGLVSDVASPFGGVKESGFGREGSKYGIDEYLVLKSVTIGGIKPLGL